MQWTRTRRFQNCKTTVTVRMVHGLQGMAWCPKPTPSAVGEALQCRAGGAPVRRSEEIRRRSKALHLPAVRISPTRTQSATHRSNRSNVSRKGRRSFRPWEAAILSARARVQPSRDPCWGDLNPEGLQRLGSSGP